MRDSDTDSDFRGWQELLLVTGSGDSSNPTRLLNWGSFIDCWVRTSPSGGFGWSGSDLTIVSVDGNLVTAETDSGPDFVEGRDEGKPVRVGAVGSWPGNAATVEGNNGTFVIESVLGTRRFTFRNSSASAADGNNGSIGWSVCTSLVMMVDAAGEHGLACRLDLENVDWRYGYDWTWGSLYVAQNVDAFVRMRNHSSTRWYGISCDGYLIVETDGSACWIGSLAFAGNGAVHTYPMAGTEIHTNQNAIASWTDHQSIAHYVPNNPSDWDGPPDTHHGALDELAGRTKSTETDVASLQSAVNALAYTKPLVIHIGTAGAQPVNPASETTRDIVIIADTQAATDDITTALGDGGFDGQTVTLIMGPMTGGKTWAVTPTHRMWFSGSTFTFDGLAQAAVLRWYTYSNGWCIQSMFDPASPPAKPAIA